MLDTPEAGGLVVRGGVLRAGALVASTALGVVAVVLLTRQLGVGGYGRYQTAVSVMAIVQVIVDAGMGTAAAREYAQRTGADRDRFVRVLLGLRLVLTTMGVGAAALVVVAAGDAGLGGGTALLGLALLAALLQGTLVLPLVVDLRLGTIAAMDLVRQVLVTLAVVVVVLAGGGVVAALATAIPANLVVLAWAWRTARGRVPLRPVLAPREMAAIVRPVAAVALALTVGVAYLYAAQVLTAIVADAHDTGIYAVAFRIFVVAAAVPATVATGAFPLLARAARDDPARLRAAVAQLTEGLLLFGCAASLGFAFAAGTVVDLVGGDANADAASVLRIVAAVLPVTFALPALGFAQLALGRNRTLTLANATGLATLLIAVPLGVHADGADGAAYGSVAGELVIGLAYVLVLRAAGVRALTPTVLRIAVALAAGRLAGELAAAGGVPELATAAIALVVLGVAAVLLRAVPHGLRALVSGRR